MSIEFCTNGSFKIKYNDETITNEVQKGGAKKKRFYIYNKHRYTKTYVREGKKHIYCKTENKYIPIRGLKGGAMGNDNNAEACATKPLPPEVMDIIKSKVYQNNKLALKDIFAFYIATNQSEKNETLNKFMQKYIRSMLQRNGDNATLSIYFGSIVNGSPDSFYEQFNMENIDVKTDMLLEFLKGASTLTSIQCSIYTNNNSLANSSQAEVLKSYLMFLNHKKVSEFLSLYKQKIKVLKKPIRNTVQNVKKATRKYGYYYDDEDKIKVNTLFKILQELHIYMKEIENGKYENMNTLEYDIAYIKHHLDIISNKLKIFKNAKNNNAKENAYNDLKLYVENHEPDEPDEPYYGYSALEPAFYDDNYYVDEYDWELD
jgi:hypothetical protein